MSLDRTIYFIDSEVHIAIKVQTRAKKSGVKGLHDGKIKIGIAFAPVDGKANAELINYLSKELSCPKSTIRIVKGETSHEKVLALRGITIEKVYEWLRKFELEGL